MFEGQPQAELEAMMKSSPEFRQLYYRHQELDKQVLDAELGVLPLDDTTLDIRNGRHPVVETALGRGAFVPNRRWRPSSSVATACSTRWTGTGAALARLVESRARRKANRAPHGDPRLHP